VREARPGEIPGLCDRRWDVRGFGEVRPEDVGSRIGSEREEAFDVLKSARLVTMHAGSIYYKRRIS